MEKLKTKLKKVKYRQYGQLKSVYALYEPSTQKVYEVPKSNFYYFVSEAIIEDINKLELYLYY